MAKSERNQSQSGKRAVSHGIRPPKIPRGESTKVTIANYDRQIRMLINRCVELEIRKSELERKLLEKDGEWPLEPFPLPGV